MVSVKKITSISFSKVNNLKFLLINRWVTKIFVMKQNNQAYCVYIKVSESCKVNVANH